MIKATANYSRGEAGLGLLRPSRGSSLCVCTSSADPESAQQQHPVQTTVQSLEIPALLYGDRQHETASLQPQDSFDGMCVLYTVQCGNEKAGSFVQL